MNSRLAFIVDPPKDLPVLRIVWEIGALAVALHPDSVRGRLQRVLQIAALLANQRKIEMAKENVKLIQPCHHVVLA